MPCFTIQQKLAKCIRKGSSMDFGWLFISNKYSYQFFAVVSETLLWGLLMSLVWILKPVIWHIEEEGMSLWVFYYCIWSFLCCCHSFNLTFVSFVTISAVLCHCSKTMYGACQNFTLTRPCQLIIFHNQ